MKIWVVGSQGMLGTSLLNLCEKLGLAACGTSRQEADITDLFSLRQQFQRIQPTHIVNCAAFTDVDGAEKNSQAAFAINSQGAANVAYVAQKNGARLIHISTDYVFSGKNLEPYREDDLCEPANAYGMSKREGELRVLDIAPNACVLRTSWLFGSKGKNFISSVLKWLQEKEELQVVFDQCGKPTYCHDLARAVLSLLSAEGIVHFANAGARSRFQIAVDIMQLAKDAGHNLKCQKIIPVPSARFPTPAVRPAYTVLDTHKFYLLTKQQPRSWSEVINEFILHALPT